MAINFPDSPSNGDTFTASGKSFVYNSTTQSWSAVTSGSAINLSSITSDILPDADSSRSLGSPTKKWKDLHLSGNTLFLGDSGSISSAAGGEIILPSIKIGTGDNAVKLETDASGKLKTKSVVSGVTQAAEEPGNATIVANMAGLVAVTGMTAGQIALVTSLNKVFMYTGSAWYLIATMTNASPTAITGVDGSYTLATDGTATTITAVSTDPEGFPLTWSYAITAGSLTNGGGATATVTQGTGANTNVFTITPTTTQAYAGTFSLTFSVTDGATGAVNAVSAFTLVFTPPLPTSGLVGLYDMNDTNSYSGSGSTWSDVSGNSGPDLTIDTNKATYNSSGIGGIPSISLDTDTRLPAIKTGTGTYHQQGQSGSYSGGSNPNAGLLTSSVYPGAGTVVMIYSRPSSNTQTDGYVMSAQTSQGAALVFGSSASNSALKTGSAGTGYWFHNAAQTTSKFYIDKVDQTSMTEQQFKNFLLDSNNQDKYHSITLTDGHFWNGWTSSNIHANFPGSSLQGEIRALVFYNRVLTSAEIDDVHDHFAGDYTSSEMA